MDREKGLEEFKGHIVKNTYQWCHFARRKERRGTANGDFIIEKRNDWKLKEIG